MDNDCITFSSEAHRLCILNKAQNAVQTEDILIQNFTELSPIGKNIYKYLYVLSVISKLVVLSFIFGPSDIEKNFSLMKYFLF